MTDSQACCTVQPIPSSPNAKPFKYCQVNTHLMPENNNPNQENHLLVNGETCHMDTNCEMMESEMQRGSRHLRKNLRLNLGETHTDNSLPPPKSSWLLRLFESKLFDMSIAIAYLFHSKEPGVLTYLGNKLFVSMIYLGFHNTIWVVLVPLACDLSCSVLQNTLDPS